MNHAIIALFALLLFYQPQITYSQVNLPEQSLLFDLNSEPDGFFFSPPEGFSSGNLAFIPVPDDSELTDGLGLSIQLEPGQGLTVFMPPVSVGRGLAHIITSVRTSSADVSVAVAGLNVNGNSFAGLDGSVASNLPANSAEFVNEWRVLDTIIDPAGDTVSAVLQAVATGNETVTVYFDQLGVTPLRDLSGQEMRDLFDPLRGEEGKSTGGTFEDFETGNFAALPWGTEGSAPWLVDTVVGFNSNSSATTGALGQNEESTLKLSVSIPDIPNSGIHPKYPAEYFPNELFCMSFRTRLDGGRLDFFINGRHVAAFGLNEDLLPNLTAVYDGTHELTPNEWFYYDYGLELGPGDYDFEWTYTGDSQVWLDDLAIDAINADTDVDGDGLINNADNCPCDYNPTQLDTDGDGYGDACEMLAVHGAVTAFASYHFIGTREQIYKSAVDWMQLMSLSNIDINFNTIQQFSANNALEDGVTFFSQLEVAQKIASAAFDKGYTGEEEAFETAGEFNDDDNLQFSFRGSYRDIELQCNEYLESRGIAELFVTRYLDTDGSVLTFDSTGSLFIRAHCFIVASSSIYRP